MKIVTILAILSPFFLTAQSWSWVTPVDGSGGESCAVLQALEGGGLVAGGAFTGNLAVQGITIEGMGNDDLYLLRLGAGQELEWALAAGSAQDDETTALAELPDGDIAFAGAFWFGIQLGDTLLSSGSTARSLFVARLSPEGQLRWARSIPGQGLKNITGLVARSDGSLALTGYFEQNLDLDPFLLDSGRDDGSTFAFVAALNGDGTTLWAQQAGHSNDTRANAIALLPDGGLAIGGFFNDTTRFEAEQFTANTFDPDAFIASYAAGGAFRWVRKAGGVVDDEIRALAAAPGGSIYATGTMIGVMAVSEDIVLQTASGNPNFFLLQYSSDGEPLFGRTLGNAQIQRGLAIDAREGQVAISGTFTGDLELDGLSISSGGVPHGFVAGFNAAGEGRWLISIPADVALVASCLDIGPEGEVIVGGSYAQMATFDDEVLTAMGSTGGFIGQLNPALTPVVEQPIRELGVQISPNPGSGHFYLKPRGLPYNIQLYDGLGRLVGRWEGVDELHLNGLPSGLYNLVVRRGDERRVLRVQLY
ncbi:MAG: T9SS type A sorting domain-containing protein [Lewinellaceae bacterium]|nr:T9SS type A sorting domain-containing protein [Phaeodactylibacter sp.]MCB9038297.1 T9SS type A sorting domain-containing protein [Lewinellaceae bacterium]